jgi:hypothetical protein
MNITLIFLWMRQSLKVVYWLTAESGEPGFDAPCTVSRIMMTSLRLKMGRRLGGPSRTGMRGLRGWLAPCSSAPWFPSFPTNS